MIQYWVLDQLQNQQRGIEKERVVRLNARKMALPVRTQGARKQTHNKITSLYPHRADVDISA